MNLNPTQWLGLMAFTLSACACMAAARRRSSPWRGLAIVQIGCFAEVLIGLRVHLHEVVDGRLQLEGWYASRETWQWALLGLVALLALGSATWVAVLARRTRIGPLEVIAMLASGFVLMVFATESISLHRIDAIMYAPLGPVLLLGGWWAAGGLTVAAAALAAARR